MSDHFLVIHGVQNGEDDDIQCAEQIRSVVQAALDTAALEKDFSVEAYLYEDANDEAVNLLQWLGTILTRGQPLAGQALESFIDVVGDVVIAAENTSTAHRIREGFRNRIIQAHEAGKRVTVVAHSLGTVYALDVISELMRHPDYFDGENRDTWPVQKLVTMGSPLGLGLEIAGIKVFEKRQLPELRNADNDRFRWDNIFNPTDPVVSGAVFGQPLDIDGALGPVETRYANDAAAANWFLQGTQLALNNAWLLAHIEYWGANQVGNLLASHIRGQA